MNIKILEDSVELGEATAQHCARILNKAIAEKNSARLLLSTGKSQFETIRYLINQEVDWEKVEMFHLDEYVDLSEKHQASFRKYLKERFTSKVTLKESYFVDGEGNIEENIKNLNMVIRESPIDVALIGIGENAHIAFNDPPANFDTKEPFILVNLDDACKKQQVGEGWFKTMDDVPKQAITMSVYQILQSKVIISPVPFSSKAKAIKETMENEKTNKIPATALKDHKDFTLYLDKESSSLLDVNQL
ncbi:6-phosphogluconolactonase [Pseudogracilibacillus auburnensis]|uniref:Glucosamine-6-phosphate deaminase n=1 Tax=Pseudogracilibacillus auburnensis TaxID=1494959 RepID=A0A2V3W864_9BACI|nr:6-phosphogluconolactonase [Pseudogracilibacillus auburnensis]MBO1001712.1 6-phosphogluconolactonase [Pseudogracilibacillus auburnensis]PXW89364.1 glucosamine-6-phosphate deaminase [Pseudogracilibacillus auburnensis]